MTNEGRRAVFTRLGGTTVRVCVDMAIRTVDDAQYQARSGSFDYDMIVKSYPSTLSPGIEQVGRWGSSSRDRPGSFNFAGVADPDVDKLIGQRLNPGH